MDEELTEAQLFRRITLWVVIGIAGLILIFGGFYIIKAGQRGTLLTFGQASMDAKEPGIHFKIPVIQRIMKMEVQTQKYATDAASASKDLQTVHTQIAVNYHLIPNLVPELYVNIGENYQDRIIQPTVQEAVKAATAQFTAEELITKREVIRDKIKDLLIEKTKERYIVIEDISITNFDFSESFNIAIESKVTAEQNALAAKNKLEQVKFEAEQKVAEAKGKAEAIRIESQALLQNPQILQLRAIEKWNGVLPYVTGGAIPLININQTAGA